MSRQLKAIARWQPLYLLAGLLLLGWLVGVLLGWLPWVHILLAAALCSVMARMVLQALRLSAADSSVAPAAGPVATSVRSRATPTPDTRRPRTQRHDEHPV